MSPFADATVGVLQLETMARAAGLLGERQRISNAKVFKRAKQALSIKSVRAGFGSRGGWLWELPRDREAAAPLSREASAKSSIKRQPVRDERRVPIEWIEGVTRLQCRCPIIGVPQHRWRQFIDDCNNFLNSKQAQRAAPLGWDVYALLSAVAIAPWCIVTASDFSGPSVAAGWSRFIETGQLSNSQGTDRPCEAS
jgi:hypothetical protein